MMKVFKRFLAFALPVFAVIFSVSGCGCGDGGENADLVFINDSDAAIAAVVVSFEDRGGGTQHADSSPLKRGETFGFEAGEYPVTVAVYETPPEPFTDIGPEALASTVIQEAPPDGERWYVTARDGAGGLVLTADTHWPEGV